MRVHCGRCCMCVHCANCSKTGQPSAPVKTTKKKRSAMEHRRHQPLFYSRLQLLYGYFWFDNVEVRRRGRCCFLYPFILFDGIPFFFILFFLEREPLQFFSLYLSHSHTRTHIHRQTEKHKTAAPKKKPLHNHLADAIFSWSKKYANAHTEHGNDED